MIESSDLLGRQLNLFNKTKDLFHIENNMLFLNELKQQSDIKSFYLRMKIPAEFYSIRVAPLLVKWVGSSRRAENIFLLHPHSLQCLEKLIERFRRRIQEQDSDSEMDENQKEGEVERELSQIEFKYVSRIAYWTIVHLTTNSGSVKIWRNLNNLLQYQPIIDNLLKEIDILSIFNVRQYGDKGIGEDKNKLHWI